MNEQSYDRMEEQLFLHEGFEPLPYVDTEGIWTVGVGYNLDARGIDMMQRVLGKKFALAPGEVHVNGLGRQVKTGGKAVHCPWKGLELTRDEARKLLRDDIIRYEAATRLEFPFYDKLSDIRQRVVLDMAFNMGYRALGFVNTRKFVEQENWSRAAQNMFLSKWSRQVGDGPGGRFDRVDRLTKMLLTNQDYTA